jgi:hypothetical protein
MAIDKTDPNPSLPRRRLYAVSDQTQVQTAKPGFFANLTSAQKDAALAYRGPENHGDTEFRLASKRGRPPVDSME